MAFIGATILSKEYKQEYPWISALGYSSAAITGLSRVANNRHWMHDVLFGAGLGVLTTEIVYSFTDLCFNKKNKHIFNPAQTYDVFDSVKPSYANVYMTYNWKLFPRKDTKLNNGTEYYIHNGVSIGLEGAYFLNNHFGISLRLKEDAYEFDNQNIWWPEDSVCCIHSLELAPVVSTALNSDIFCGARIGIGLNHIKANQLQDDIVIDKQNNFVCSAGVFANLWMESIFS